MGKGHSCFLYLWGAFPLFYSLIQYDSPTTIVHANLSNTAWIISQAVPWGGEARNVANAWLFADSFANRRKPALSFRPPVYPWLRRDLNPNGTRRFYLAGTRRFYVYSLAECRSPNSHLLIPPLLRLGSVGVLISVPVALLECY